MKDKLAAIIIIMICIYFVFGFSSGFNEIVEDSHHKTSEEVFENVKYEESNVDKCERIAKEYYETHTYIDNDVYDCDIMAGDVWNLLKTEGINSKIAVGNVDYDIDSINDANHAWIMAETSPNRWIAIECTGGHIVYHDDNPLYYKSWTFNNPKNLREYISLCRDYNNQVERYNSILEKHNRLLSKYVGKTYPNNELYLIQSRIDDSADNVNNEMRILNNIQEEIDYILTYG